MHQLFARPLLWIGFALLRRDQTMKHYAWGGRAWTGRR